eukprot:6492782-Amphidinium_carterae.2
MISANLCSVSAADQVKKILLEQLNLVDGIHLANRVQRLASSRTNLAKETNLGVIQRWEDSIGKQQLCSMSQTFPQLKQHKLRAIPSAGAFTFEQQPQASEGATAALSWSMKNDEHFAKQLSNAWHHHHEMVRQPAAPKKKKTVDNIPSLCQTTGFCVCQPRSRLLRRLHKHFLADLKKIFSLPDTKPVLGAGKVVVCFTSDAGEGFNAPAAELIFSIPLMYWKPYRPTLQQCARATAQDTWYSDTCSSFWIEALGIYIGAYEALQQLDLGRVWCKQYFFMSDHQTPVISICPKFIPVQELTDSRQLWPITVARRAVGSNAHAWALFSARHAQSQVSGDGAASEEDSVAEDEPESSDEEEEAEVADDETAWIDGLVEHLALEEAAVAWQDAGRASGNSLAVGVEERLAEEEAGGQPMQLQPFQSRQFYGRVAADASCHLTGKGRIAWHASKEGFECLCSRHANCTMSRKSTRTNRTNGRPLGLMAAWLNMECSAAEHKDAAFLKSALSYESRVAGRELLNTIDGGAALFALEHPRDISELEEPATLKGLL